MSSRGRTSIVVLLIDAACPLLAVGWHGLRTAGHIAAPFANSPWLILTALAFPLALAVAELYNPRSSWWSPATALRAAGAAFAVALLFGGAQAIVGSRGEFLWVTGVMGGTMAAVAFASRAVVGLRMRGQQGFRHALVVGVGWAGRQVIDCTLFEPRLRIRIVGAIDDDPLKRNIEYKGVSVVGTGADLVEAAARYHVDLVIAAIPRSRSAELAAGLVRLALDGVEIVDMPGFVEQVTGQIPIRSAEGAWLVYGGGFDALRHPWRGRLKRAFDLAVAGAAVAFALPLLATVALLVRLGSRGPVFLHLERAGRGEKPVHLVKFRTMEKIETPAGPDQRLPGSYRLTKIGRLLRRTRLDEIPQLYNVLKGDLSFVGPRPERPAVAERLGRLIPLYALRFSVAPGLTGWAQVQHQFGTALDEPLERLKYDFYYVKNMSFRLDFFVLLKTLKLVFFPTGR